MAKISIKEFKGLYTNIDENDLSLDRFQVATNAGFENGYCYKRNRNLALWPDVPSLSEINSYISGGEWEYETGLFAILTNDSLSEDPIATQYRVFVLIVKDNSTPTRRLVFIKDIDAEVWYELSAESSAPYSLSGIDISRSFFTTDKEGESFIKTEDGVVKIYMPHDCFWLGRLERKIYNKDKTTPANPYDYNQYYIDRLVETFNGKAFGLDENGNCLINRRIGMAMIADVNDTGSAIVDKVNLTYSYITEHSTADEEFPYYKIYEYEFEDPDGQEILNPITSYFPWPSEKNHWAIKEYTTGNYIIPKEYFDSIGLLSGAAISTIGTLVDTRTTGLWGEIVDRTTQIIIKYVNTGYHEFYVIPKATFEAQSWIFKGSGTIADTGFDQADNEYNIVATVTFDDKEEIVAYTINDKPTVGGKYAISIEEITLAKDINKRVSRISIYMKLKDELDYELIKEFNLLDDEEESYKSKFSITTTSKSTGIFLSQRIGILYNPDKPGDYYILTGFRDVAEDRDVKVAVSNDDYTGLFYSTVGGGVLQSDLFYRANKLKMQGLSFVTALSKLDNAVLACTNSKSFVIASTNVSGVLAFNIRDTLEFGAKNRKDIATIEGGVVINTIDGIFLTNGYDKQKLSEPINDKVGNLYSASSIFYDEVNHELYLVVRGMPSVPVSFFSIYRYNFKESTWSNESLISFGTGLDTQEIIFDSFGDRVVIFGSEVVHTDPSDNNSLFNLITNKSNFGSETSDKVINYIVLDYEGTTSDHDNRIDIDLYIDGPLDISDTITLFPPVLPDGDRREQKLWIPVIKRKPFKKARVSIAAQEANFKLYAIYIDVDYIERRYDTITN